MPLYCRDLGIEFIARFLQHVLPRGTVKVRHYGKSGEREIKRGS